MEGFFYRQATVQRFRLNVYFPLRIDRVFQFRGYLQCILCTRIESRQNKRYSKQYQRSNVCKCGTLLFDQTSSIDLFLKTHRLFSNILIHNYDFILNNKNKI